MDTPKPGYVDFYFQGRIFEVPEQDPHGAVAHILQKLVAYTRADDFRAMHQMNQQYHIRTVGFQVEAGTNDLQNGLWLKVDTSRRLAGRHGTVVDPHVADLIHRAGIVGDARTGNPIAFCVPDARTGESVIWHIDPREIETMSRNQIEERLAAWVTEAVASGKLP